VTSAKFIQFGEQIANLHRCRIEDAPGSGRSPPLRRGQATVECLPDHRGDRCTALPRERANPLVTLLVDENLQPVRQHTHTLACAYNAGTGFLCRFAPAGRPFVLAVRPRRQSPPGRCRALGIADTTRYHGAMAMTLRLSDEQTEALRRKAEAEHRSMQQVALAAIDAYVHQATPARRQSVPATELMTLFQGLPPMSVEAFRADQDRYVNDEASFDAYERMHEPEDGE
jgi:hypothetical protein